MAKFDGVKPDHVHGGFQWQKAPECSCGAVPRMLESGFLFASNVSDKEAGGTMLYMLPMDAEGELAAKHFQVAYCPCCGDKIVAQKQYPTG